VIVAHELSRLWRSESEMHAIKEELEYLNVHVVTDDGIDTRIAGMDMLIAIKGAMAKQELRQIAQPRQCGLHAYGNKLRLPRVRPEKQLLSWIHGILVGDDAGEHLLRAWRSWSGEKLPTPESSASAHGERLDELCDEISNLIDAVAHGALRLSPMLAQRLTEAELKLAAEEGRVALQQGVGAVSPYRPLNQCSSISALCRPWQNDSRRAHAKRARL
jgi:hypothetical protein